MERLRSCDEITKFHAGAYCFRYPVLCYVGMTGRRLGRLFMSHRDGILVYVVQPTSK